MPSASSKLHTLPPLDSSILVVHVLSMPKKASAKSKSLPLILAVPAQKSQKPRLRDWTTHTNCGLLWPKGPAYERAVMSNASTATLDLQITKHIPQVCLSSSVIPGFCTLNSSYIFGLEMTKKTRHMSTKCLPIQKKEHLGNWRMRLMKDGIKKYR